MQAAEQLIVIDGYCRGPGRCRIGTHLDEEIDQTHACHPLAMVAPERAPPAPSYPFVLVGLF